MDNAAKRRAYDIFGIVKQIEANGEAGRVALILLVDILSQQKDAHSEVYATWDDDGSCVCCTVCGISMFHQDENNNAGIEPSKFKYCPNCGAKMDERRKKAYKR